MATIDEVGSTPTQIFGALRDGLEALDLNQSVSFIAYSRVVLPIDGYVFWQPLVEPVVVQGSLHYSQDIVQNEDETYGLATVVFTAESQVTAFTDMPINTIYVASVGNFRYSFSAQQGFYSQAGLWHYMGHTIAPAVVTQLLDAPTTLDPLRAVTSNSLALWLALNDYKSIYWDGFSNSIQLFPSFLVSPNLIPPYGSIHIEPSVALQPIPLLSRDRTSTQLVSDRVRITLYGLQSDETIDFLNCVWAYSRDTDNFGIMNMPTINDGKRVQTELQAIAMQKTIEFEISYYQTRVQQVSRQLILSAPYTLIVADL
jgi:hypothetical protein